MREGRDGEGISLKPSRFCWSYMSTALFFYMICSSKLWVERDLNKKPWFKWSLHSSTFGPAKWQEWSKVLSGCCMGHGRDWRDPVHVFYSPFQHKAWETEKKTARGRLKPNKSKQLFPQHLVKLRNSLLGMLRSVCGFKKWWAKFIRKKKKSLNTKHHLCLMCLRALKCWRLREWCWKNVTRFLPCCCSFSLAYPVDHRQWQSTMLERPLALPSITDLTLCEPPQQLPVCVPSPQQTWGNLD